MLKCGGKFDMGVVAYFIFFPTAKEFWRSVKFWSS